MKTACSEIVPRGRIIKTQAETFKQLQFHSHSTHTHNCFTALWTLSGTTRVSQYQKKHSPTHTHRGHQISLSASSILRSMASSLFNPHTATEQE